MRFHLKATRSTISFRYPVKCFKPHAASSTTIFSVQDALILLVLRRSSPWGAACSMKECLHLIVMILYFIHILFVKQHLIHMILYHIWTLLKAPSSLSSLLARMYSVLLKQASVRFWQGHATCSHSAPRRYSRTIIPYMYFVKFLMKLLERVCMRCMCTSIMFFNQFPWESSRATHKTIHETCSRSGSDEEGSSSSCTHGDVEWGHASYEPYTM
jgi:hypothetical protein